MRPHTTYLICATHRTGSTLLCEGLSKTELAGAPREYFWRDYQQAWFQRLEVTSFAEYVKELLRQTSTPNGVFGAKIMWAYSHAFFDHLQQLSCCAGLSRSDMLAAVFPNLHYIWITRHDKVRQAVSLVRAVQSQVWVRRADDPIPPARDLVYDDDAIDRWLQRIHRDEVAWRQFFEDGGIRPLELVYEEFVDAYETTLLEVLQYLEVPVPTDLAIDEPDMVRQSDALSEEWIQRFEHRRCRTVGAADPTSND